jgi:hypothetical protein
MTLRASSPVGSASWVFLASLWVSSSLHAQLLTNTRFDTDVSGWLAGNKSTVQWDPLDFEASPVSGSALVTNISDTTGDSDGPRQCVVGVVEGGAYEVAAEVYIPGAQSETGWADLLVQWYSDAGCKDFLDLATTSRVLSSTPDAWLPVNGSLVAPAGSQSANVRLSVRKQQDTGSLAAHFDNVVFAPVIFSDDFESGTTCLWSATVGSGGCPGLPATGWITTIPAARLVDGEAFTLADGSNPPVSFEFELAGNGVSPGSVPVDSSGDTSAEDVRNTIIFAVNSSGIVEITASDGGIATVDLTNNQPGDSGNQPIIETVADPGFEVQGMSGGVDPTP